MCSPGLPSVRRSGTSRAGARPGIRGWGRVSAPLLLGLAVGAAPLRGQAGELPASTPQPEPGLASWGDADLRWRIRPLGEEEIISLERFRGEVLFINLWASWCIPCVRELASIERLRARLADTDIAFLLVAAEGEAPVRRFLRLHPYQLPFYLEASRMPSSWGLRGLPTTWVVDRDGRIVLLRHGEAVWDTEVVEAFLRGVAEGCSAARRRGSGTGRRWSRGLMTGGPPHPGPEGECQRSRRARTPRFLG